MTVQVSKDAKQKERLKAARDAVSAATKAAKDARKVLGAHYKQSQKDRDALHMAQKRAASPLIRTERAALKAFAKATAALAKLEPVQAPDDKAEEESEARTQLDAMTRQVEAGATA